MSDFQGKWAHYMPVKTIDKGTFIYIAYRREGYQDFARFRKIIEEFEADNGTPHDIIVDLSKSAAITDAEVTLLVKVMRDFQSTTRHLRIIANNTVLHKLLQMNLDKSDKVHLYSDHNALIADLNAPAETKPTPAPPHDQNPVRR